MTNSISAITAIELAYGKGKIKKWALEKVILNLLYETTIDHACYLKLQDISTLTKPYEETEKEYILKFGYLFRIPKTEIDLHIVKNSNKLYLTKEGIGFGYDAVEDEILKYILNQKASNNLYFRTNLNGIEFKI